MLSRVPYPLIKGDKLRAYHHIRELSRKHEIILCALSDETPHPQALSELEKYCSQVHIFRLSKTRIFLGLVQAFFNRKPLQVGYFCDSKIKNRVKQIIDAVKPEHIFCQLIRVSEYVKEYNIPKTLDYQDVFSKGVGRRIKTVPYILKPLFGMEYRRLLRYEREIFGCFNHKIIISKPDRDLIPHKDNQLIHVVPNGVDLAYFSPRTAEKEYDLVFTGNMAYPPNVNAVMFLVKEILPQLRKHKPEIKILIAGAHPVRPIRCLQSENVHVTGWVEDLRDCYARSKIFIAPMQIGTGLQNKLLEAMAMQLPCVSSDLANRALCAQNGREILLGFEPEEYVGHILNLLNDNAFADEIARNGSRFVKENYNWESLTTQLDQIITGCDKANF
ncbi:MAG: Glycosyl transferases group 1 [Bacteroidetes bacterium ADurb.Bin408]|nr:MAG: Glycosyl transferases group 1 [Bacteroidetes bacterium ADurb.Bin408]